MGTIETELPRTTFAGGEATPTLRARSDLARNLTGVARLSNLAVLFEGAVTRCPGTQFIGELKTMSQKGEFGPFRFSPTDAYHLVFNDQTMRLTYNGGIVEASPGVPFELAVPWLEADLPNLRLAQAGNVIYATCKGYEPRRLTRVEHTNWTIENYLSRNGPVGLQNLDTAKTMKASAVIGSITVTTGFDIFTAQHVGTIWRLDEIDLTSVPLWTANETIALTFANISYAGSSNFGDFTDGGGGLAAAFDNNNATHAQASAFTGVRKYIGKTLAAASTVARAQVTLIGGISWNTVWELRGKNGSAPASASDGDLLCELSVGANVSSFNLVSNNALTSYAHVWITGRHHATITETGAGFSTGFLVAEIVFQNYSSSTAVLRRWQGRIYQVIAAGNSGSNPPTHDEGDVLSGTGGVSWRFYCLNYGFFRITAVTDPQHATADVLTTLPLSVTQRDSYRWSPPAWSEDAGWPDLVLTMDRSLVFWRDNEFWKTRPNTDDNFSFNDDPEDPDTAINSRVTSNAGLLVQALWAVASGVLVTGVVDGEYMLRAPQAFEPWTATNIRAIPDSDEGSAPHVPAIVDGGVLFIGKSRERLHWLKFNSFTEKLEPEEITKAARHILAGKAVQLAWQKDPNRVLWVRCADGTLMACTFFPKEKVVGFFRRPFVNGFVESVSAVPSADQSSNAVELLIRRTINGTTKRYIERMRPFFRPVSLTQPTAAGAWFLDCAIEYNGAETTTLSGLGHLEGEWVGVFTNGVAHPRRQVTDGQIPLDRPVTHAVTGLPTYWDIESLPAEGVVRDAKGTSKTANHIMLDLLHAAGGKAVVNDGEPEDLMLTGGMNYAQPLPLRTGPVRVPVSSPHADELIWKITGGGFEDAYPFTLLAATPAAEIETD